MLDLFFGGFNGNRQSRSKSNIDLHISDEIASSIVVTRSARRSISIVISADGEVSVRAPYSTSDSEIAKFYKSKQDWILRNIRRIKKRSSQREIYKTKHCFAVGDSFLYLGKQYPLIINPQLERQFRFSEGFHFAKADKPFIKKKILSWYKKQASDIFNVRVLVWEQSIGVNHQKIRISSAKTRWGSCSSTGTISLNWKLIMAPLEIIDYVIVHELVHIIHPNHSHAFWDTVGRFCPEYKAKRKWLKINGDGLAWV